MTGHEATSVIMRWMFLSYFYEEVEDYSCCTERIIVHANIGAIRRSITAKVLLLLPLQWYHAQRKHRTTVKLLCRYQALDVEAENSGNISPSPRENDRSLQRICVSMKGSGFRPSKERIKSLKTTTTVPLALAVKVYYSC